MIHLPLTDAAKAPFLKLSERISAMSAMSAYSRHLSVALLLVTVGCGGAKDATKAAAAPSSGASATAATAGTGKVIVVEMITDGAGNYFKPKEVEAHPGDILRFTLTVGVHNVHFVADSNPGVPNLPETSDLLQLPGQTVDVVVPTAAGKSLFFQCDAHAALGMIGHVKVTDK